MNGAGRLALVLAVCACMAAPRSAHAQRAERASSADPTELTDEQLERDGWTFSRQRAKPGSPAAGVLALTLGAPVHGIGHFATGDRRTGARLLAAEGISLAAFGAGMALWRTSDSVALRETGSALQAAAASVFVASWLADVLGATKGSGADLPTNTFRAEGFSGEFAFGTLIGEGAPLTTSVELGLGYESRRVVVAPTARLATDLSARRVGATAGVRFPLSKRPDSFLELGGGGFDEAFPDVGTGRTSLRGTVRLSLDLGDIFRHLANFVWENDVSFATDFSRLDAVGGGRIDGGRRTFHAPFGFLLHANLDQGVNLALGYRHDRDRWVGTLGRRAGTIQGRLSIVPRNRLGIELRGEQGAFTEAVIGVRYAFTR